MACRPLLPKGRPVCEQARQGPRHVGILDGSHGAGPVLGWGRSRVLVQRAPKHRLDAGAQHRLAPARCLGVPVHKRENDRSGPGPHHGVPGSRRRRAPQLVGTASLHRARRCVKKVAGRRAPAGFPMQCTSCSAFILPAKFVRPAFARLRPNLVEFNQLCPGFVQVCPSFVKVGPSLAPKFGRIRLVLAEFHQTVSKFGQLGPELTFRPTLVDLRQTVFRTRPTLADIHRVSAEFSDLGANRPIVDQGADGSLDWKDSCPASRRHLHVCVVVFSAMCPCGKMCS